MAKAAPYLMGGILALIAIALILYTAVTVCTRWWENHRTLARHRKDEKIDWVAYTYVNSGGIHIGLERRTRKGRLIDQIETRYLTADSDDLSIYDAQGHATLTAHRLNQARRQPTTATY